RGPTAIPGYRSARVPAPGISGPVQSTNLAVHHGEGELAGLPANRSPTHGPHVDKVAIAM
ncbi:MAG TPA: hypothetical protein VGA61_09950, partial [Anaerolineae bacterium]